ncbi:MAG: YihA family ribosome biogenesis GTP-binding protein, partial [Flavobacteriales bacterium]
MEVKTAEFLKSSAHPKECPPADRPEYAFIGRSNV